MSWLLLYLPALACPLLMLLCLAGMRRMDRSAGQATGSTADRLAKLERGLATLHDQRQRPGQAAPQPQDGVAVLSDPGP